MAVEIAKQDVQVSVGKDFVIMGTDRVEVSPDGNKVTAYTNDGVETKAASGAATQGISISADFNTVVLNGATIERAADGHLVISAPGTVITKPGPANDTAPKGKAAPEIGDEMEDGTILAGYYQGKPLYATPKDAPATYTFNEAAKYAKNLDAHGHHDFHAPSQDELTVLYENRNKGRLKGTFNETGSHPAGWYWSSSPRSFDTAWTQRFSDGNQCNHFRNYVSSLRCVR
jgi:uncharacterized protein (DUF2345 family)